MKRVRNFIQTKLIERSNQKHMIKKRHLNDVVACKRELDELEDGRIHYVIYIFSHLASSNYADIIKKELQLVKELSPYCNVVPVLSKADTY
jgi:septin family protein